MEDTNQGADPRALQDLDRSEEELKDLIQQAGSDPDHKTVIANSAFILGWQVREESIALGDYRQIDPQLKLLRKIISICDQPGGPTEVAAEAVAMLSKLTADREAEIEKNIARTFGAAAAKVIIQRSQVLSPQDAFMVGLSFSIANKAFLVGFVMLREDTRLRCHCPMCLAEGAAVLPPHETTFEIEVERLGGYEEAVREFGRHVNARYYQDLSRALGEEVTEADPNKADEEYHSLLTRMKGGKRE